MIIFAMRLLNYMVTKGAGEAPFRLPRGSLSPSKAPGLERPWKAVRRGASSSRSGTQCVINSGSGIRVCARSVLRIGLLRDLQRISARAVLDRALSFCRLIPPETGGTSIGLARGLARGRFRQRSVEGSGRRKRPRKCVTAVLLPLMLMAPVRSAVGELAAAGEQ